MTSANPAERRVFPRRDLRTPVVFEDEFGEGLFYVYSENISLGGIFLASGVPLRPGTMLFLSFHLPEYKRPMRLTGEVVRVSHAEGGGGIGVRFVGVPEAILKRLQLFIVEES